MALLRFVNSRRRRNDRGVRPCQFASVLVVTGVAVQRHRQQRIVSAGENNPASPLLVAPNPVDQSVALIGAFAAGVLAPEQSNRLDALRHRQRNHVAAVVRGVQTAQGTRELGFDSLQRISHRHRNLRPIFLHENRSRQSCQPCQVLGIPRFGFLVPIRLVVQVEVPVRLSFTAIPAAGMRG